MLSRKKGEIIRIDDHIQIIVVEIRDRVVRLGIDCPREIPVHREEIYNKLKTK